MGSELLVGAIGLLALIGPGWLVARASHIRPALLGGFIGSVVTFTAVVTALAVLNVPLTFAAVSTAWALVGAASLTYFLRARTRQASTQPSGSTSAWRTDWPILLPLIPMLAIVSYRACAQPLFGVDTIFRWNYLAEQMFARHSLGFYPPVTGSDYEIYSWPDGIAPVVSSLYFWLYSFAGATKPALTSPTVILQFLLVIMSAFALGRKFFSERAGIFAAALIACSPMIAWSTVMGQETGLTALSLAGLLLYLPGSRTEENRSSIVFAALAASLGGLAREYGLAIPVLGFVLCAVRRLSLHGCITFLLVILFATTPWYIRNWVLTGNPLFNLSIGTLFPVNEVHRTLNDAFRAQLGWSNLPASAPRLLVVNCFSCLVGGIAGAVIFYRRSITRALLIASALIVMLWAASLGYTAAGFFYSLRVLNPALVLLTVLGGAALARWIPGERAKSIAILVLCVVATDAALRLLTLPANVYRIPIARWPQVGNALHEYHARPIYRELVNLTGQERMLVLGPNAILSKLGARTVPLWSPEVRFIYEADLSPQAIAQKLKAARIGFVLLNRTGVNEAFLARSVLFRNPTATLQQIWADEDMVLLKIQGP